jgi:two-component system, NarL family, response regulator NreC
MALTVMLADDHRIVRQGLRALLAAEPGLELVGEAGDGPEAVRLAERLHPDVLVLDLMLPGLGGLDVARELAHRSPRTRVVVLSMHADLGYVWEAVRAGALGYVVKEAGAAELVRAVRTVAAGQRYLGAPLSEEALAAYAARAGEGGGDDPYAGLTFREREVLQLTVEGLSGAEVAARLFISPRTVESHRASLMRKLGVRNQKELIRYAVGRGVAAEPVRGEREGGPPRPKTPPGEIRKSTDGKGAR